MTRNFLSWYSSMPLSRRRFLIAALVPVQEYLFLEPCRRALNTVAKASPELAIACLPLLLLAGVLTALVVSLFIYEFFMWIGCAVRNKVAALAFLACAFAWVILPLHFINSIGGK